MKDKEPKTIDFKKSSSGAFVVDKEKEKKKENQELLKGLGLLALGIGAIIVIKHLNKK